ncbi:MAG TPA: hypothetical protein VFO99_12780 [Pyrinomonadaceae bacterium]|nr:hypothetical protein [Pyrinomonadaceae bacterium]
MMRLYSPMVIAAFLVCIAAFAAQQSPKFNGTARGLLIVVLRIGLIVVLAGAGWLLYRELPATSAVVMDDNRKTSLQIVLRQPDNGGSELDMAVSLYPVDVVAVRHEFFTEPRAGKRFEDFLRERMKGRSPVSTRLDKQGQGAIMLAPGSWWLHGTLSGDEQLEWRLPVTVVGAKQIVELTPQNAYTRSKSF